MWILWIHGLDLPKQTQNPFLDSEIHIWIFPKKRTLRVDIQIKSFYFSVRVVVELSSNIMRGNWGFRWWPKNALPKSRRDGPGRRYLA